MDLELIISFLNCHLKKEKLVAQNGNFHMS
jgi:hypothetical protein